MTKQDPTKGDEWPSADEAYEMTRPLELMDSAGRWQEEYGLPDRLSERYRLNDLLHVSPHGLVASAIDLEQGDAVAVKIFNADRQAAYRREIAASLGLRHPLLVTCVDTFSLADGRACVVTPYFAEGSLLDALANERLTTDQKLDALDGVLVALEALHQSRLVHCDVKPANVLLDRRDRTNFNYLLCDFGSATPFLEAQRKPSTSGSPAYTAPERLFDGFGPTADLYSVGVMAFELLTGSLPFHGSVDEMYRAHLTRMPAYSDISDPRLSDWVSRLMMKTASHRYASAKAAVDALRKCRSHADEEEASPIEMVATWPSNGSLLHSDGTVGRRAFQDARLISAFPLKGEVESLLLLAAGGALACLRQDYFEIHDTLTGRVVGPSVLATGKVTRLGPTTVFLANSGGLATYDTSTGARQIIHRTTVAPVVVSAWNCATTNRTRTAWRDHRAVFSWDSASETVSSVRAAHYALQPMLVAHDQVVVFSSGIGNDTLCVWQVGDGDPRSRALHSPIRSIDVIGDELLVLTKQSGSTPVTQAHRISVHALEVLASAELASDVTPMNASGGGIWLRDGTGRLGLLDHNLQWHPTSIISPAAYALSFDLEAYRVAVLCRSAGQTRAEIYSL